jgi:hypothetical protein
MVEQRLTSEVPLAPLVSMILCTSSARSYCLHRERMLLSSSEARYRLVGMILRVLELHDTDSIGLSCLC